MTNAPLMLDSPEAPTAAVDPAAVKRRRNYLALALQLILFAVVLWLPLQIYGGDRYQLPLYTKYLAMAIFALSVDLIWGYTGLLSLGQGLFFGLGAYAMGYCLILQQAALSDGRPFEYAADMVRPDFMLQCRLNQVPFWIGPLINTWLAFAVALIIPTVIAGLFGSIVFRRGIKGVYFSLITQALLMAVFMLVSTMRPYTGGVDGLTNLANLSAFDIDFKMIVPRRPPNPAMYYLIAGALTICFLGSALLMSGKIGRLLTAIRDNENRVLALGYNTALYKTFIFTLAGVLAGLAGALFVAANRSAGPQFFSIAESIEIVIIVAVGGRGTLIGPVLGAVVVGAGKTYINDKFKMDDFLQMLGMSPTGNSVPLWPIVIGLLFILVVLFLPDGLIGGARRLAAWVKGLVWRTQIAN